MNRANRITALAMLFLASAVTDTARATLIAPHALFIDHRVRSAAMFLHNPEDQAVEIDIELVYGYPRGDGAGGVRVVLEPEPAADAPSCAAWVRALPRRVVLLPGERQTVRLLAQPPSGLPDGEYWSRVVVTSQPADRDLEGVALEGADGVRVGLTLATRTVISLNYRKGPVTTGVVVDSLRAELGDRALTVAMQLARLGDAAWIGKVDAILLDAQGAEVQRWDRALAVYEDHRRVFEFPLEVERAPGDYRLSLRYSTDRADLPSEGILPAATVVREVPLTVLPAPGR